MGGLIDGLFGGGDDNVQTPEDIYRLTQMQNRMSNPNMSNYFGSTTTTFDENDQPQINQQFSPEIQGLVDMSIASAQGGPNTFTPNANNYGNRMMGQFGDSFSNRMGAPPQAQYMQKPPADGFTPQAPPMSQPPQQVPPVGFAPPSLGGAMGGSGGGNDTGLANPLGLPNQYNIPELPAIPKMNLRLCNKTARI
jgi:hypothetical protein